MHVRAIGDAIRVVRMAKGFKVKELAERSHLSASFISLVESGDREPSLSGIRAIADALGVPSDVLLLMSNLSSSSLRSTDRTTGDVVRSVDQILKAEAELEQKLRELEGSEGGNEDASRRLDS
ncbi:helix-turn-helix domain-containing protein [Phycisphaerales bacterium AB-hyl4]|uniref:Helix-turn-helix domain-containing protein n=1 Tax=Natronomicrosphaera hydrolytica TaxID=3242702 RepID=A0ABV4U703_9BACT